LGKIGCSTDVTTLEHDPEKWQPVFGKRSCSNKEVERDDDSKKNHPALGRNPPAWCVFGASYARSVVCLAGAAQGSQPALTPLGQEFLTILT
jgi:hypothetical protein